MLNIMIYMGNLKNKTRVRVIYTLNKCLATTNFLHTTHILVRKAKENN